MKIEIKLPNPDYCNGCPMLLGQNMEIVCLKLYFDKRKVNSFDVYRPKQCKKENGE